MSWKDKRNETFKTSQERPVLGEKRVYVKDIGKGDINFVTYVKNEDGGGENVSLGSKIKGVLLGTATSYEVFDDNFGKNGGSWRTGYIFDNNNCAVFDPTGKFVMNSTREECKNYLQTEAGNRPRFLTVYFVLTVDGIYAIYTNGVIGIDQEKRYKNSLFYNYVELSAELYSNDSDVTKASQEMLGKFREKNPPKFASISVGKEIDDKFVQQTNMEATMDLFNIFRDYYINTKTDEGIESSVAAISQAEQTDIATAVGDFNNKKATPIEDDEDGLPF
jgi:hypothetical protein